MQSDENILFGVQTKNMEMMPAAKNWIKTIVQTKICNDGISQFKSQFCNIILKNKHQTKATEDDKVATILVLNSDWTSTTLCTYFWLNTEFFQYVCLHNANIAKQINEKWMGTFQNAIE